MEDLKVRYCKLCLATIQGANYEEISNITDNIEGVTLLNLDVDNSKHVACNACSQKFVAALQFKRTCSSTNHTISLYAQNTSKFPLDLREIYKKERDSENVSNYVKICCLCMQPVTNVSECNSINEGVVDMLHKFVPEMTICIIEDPVVCKLCVDSLAMHCNFLKNVEQISRNISNELPSATSSVKREDFEWEEDMPQLIKREWLDINCDVKTESEVYTGTSSEAGVKCKQELRYKDAPGHWICHEDCSTAQMFRCEICNFKTNNEVNFEGHMFVHKDPLELQMYKCEHCNFETKHKDYLKTHMLKHKDPSELQMYKCKSCNFESRYKKALKRHMLIHKDTSEVQMYRCKNCNFETKHKVNLKGHLLKHKDPSEVQMYKCENCNFETKRKENLKSHMLTHKDSSEVQMYKCDYCDYESKRKENLKSHMLKHKDSSEVQMYRCENCSFETKHKENLKHHMLIHKDPSEVQMYKCENCNFETKHKRYLKFHVVTHKDDTEVEMYKCGICRYETKYKASHKRHIKTHKSFCQGTLQM